MAEARAARNGRRARSISTSDGRYIPGEVCSAHFEPAPGLQIDPKSLEITGIVLDHPFRFAKQEKEGLDHVFAAVRAAVRKHNCQRAILVGHNAHFDLNFLNAAVARTQHKRNPFHPFSVFDTVTLGGVAFGQTVLARAVQAAGISMEWRGSALGGVRRGEDGAVVLRGGECVGGS